MSYPMFDRARLHIRPLAERVHDMTLADVLPLDHPGEPYDSPDLAQVAERIIRARAQGKPVIVLMGAHVIKAGLSRFVIDLMARGLITHVGMNGAGPIHDYELALAGGSTESVARYISEGQFGLWQETGRINDIVAAGVADGLGYGEALGRAIAEGDYPHRDISVLAAGYRLRVPVTVHIGIGQDIIHEHPNCDGAALGEASYRDFLIFTQAVTGLEGGVMLNYGTAVMGPSARSTTAARASTSAARIAAHCPHCTGW